MKAFASACVLLLCVAAPVRADTVNRAGEQAILSAYEKMEDADRRGDGQLWLSLRDRKTRDTMDASLRDAIRKGGRTRPNVSYEPSAVRVSGSRGAILGKVSDPDASTVQYDAVLFVIEDGGWKVASEQWSEKPFDRFLLYALLLPEPGSFVRQNGTWKGIPYASVNTQAVRKEEMPWKIQATMDEAYAYVRLEAPEALPMPGSKVAPEAGKTGRAGILPPPPPLRIKSPSEYTFAVNSLVSTADVAAGKGKPTTRYSAAWSFFVRNAAGEQIFESTLSDNSENPLISVRDRFVEVKIPLGGLGIDPDAKPALDLEAAGSVMLILPYHIEPFTPR